MPDVSPFMNALAWSFAIIFGCWAAMQLIDVVVALREGPQAPPAAEPPLEEPARDAHH